MLFHFRCCTVFTPNSFFFTVLLVQQGIKDELFMEDSTRRSLKLGAWDAYKGDNLVNPVIKDVLYRFFNGIIRG